DDHESAALGEPDPRFVKRGAEIERLAVERELRLAFRHAHRREHAPREALVVRIAVRDIVAKRQRELEREEREDETPSPGRDKRANVADGIHYRGSAACENETAARGGGWYVRSSSMRAPCAIGARRTSSPASSDAAGWPST